MKELLEIMSYCSTRWESLLNCTERVLRLWDFLVKYFADQDSKLKADVNNSEFHLYSYVFFVLLHRIVDYILLSEA